MTIPAIKIGERMIGPDYPTCVVAEMSANHGQSLAHAVETIGAAKQAGGNRS